MPVRRVTPWKPRAELFGGDFFRRGSYQNWRPHGSGDWLLIYTVAGAGRFASPGGACETRAGDAVLYAPGEGHDYRTSPDARTWRLLWAHFSPKPHWLPSLRWPVSRASGLRQLHMESGEVRPHFAAALRRMIGLARRELPGALDLAANAFEEALLWANVAKSEDRWLRMDPRVRRAIDHLIAHTREPFALETLARHCGASVSRLGHLFKTETGTTPQQFFERHRMQHASQLLRMTAMSIAEIADEVGYADPFYFSNRFRRFAGRSPSAYRGP